MRRLVIVAVMLAAVPVVPAYAAEDVVGGRPASRPYPWMASLQTSTGSHRCGASLVRKWWVLTAKHCVTGRTPASLQVMLGSQKRSAPGQIHQIADIRMHSDSDAAVLKLETPSSLQPIRIAGLDEKATWAPGTLATALGWGTQFFLSPTIPDQLQEVEVHIVSDADCAVLNGPLFGFDPTTEVCAGELEGGRDTCQGDSGGPLMVPDARGRFIVMGTTFYGLGCAFPGGAYGVYARVGDDRIRAWLDSQLPPEASLSAEGGAASEASSSLVFTVRKAGTTAKTVRVDFTTLDGTGTAGSDYWPVAGTLVFEPDDTTQKVFVPILQDGLAEADETVVIQLSGPVEAEIEVGTATGTITDDD